MWCNETYVIVIELIVRKKIDVTYYLCFTVFSLQAWLFSWHSVLTCPSSEEDVFGGIIRSCIYCHGCGWWCSLFMMNNVLLSAFWLFGEGGFSELLAMRHPHSTFVINIRQFFSAIWLWSSHECWSVKQNMFKREECIMVLSYHQSAEAILYGARSILSASRYLCIQTTSNECNQARIELDISLDKTQEGSSLNPLLACSCLDMTRRKF